MGHCDFPDFDCADDANIVDEEKETPEMKDPGENSELFCLRSRFPLSGMTSAKRRELLQVLGDVSITQAEMIRRTIASLTPGMKKALPDMEADAVPTAHAEFRWKQLLRKVEVMLFEPALLRFLEKKSAESAVSQRNAAGVDSKQAW